MSQDWRALEQTEMELWEEEYAEWLMEQDLMIGNGDQLLRLMESGTRYEEFTEQRNK